MADFRGGSAAVQSVRFVFNHFIAFLKLTASWAAISAAVVIAYCLIAQPAGAGASLGAHLTALDASKDRTKDLISLVPSIFGSLAAAVMWIRFVLLDKEPRNPLRLSGEMGTYFVRSIQIGFLSGAAAIPGVIVALVLASALGKPIGSIAATLAGLVAVLCFLFVYARLSIVLASAAIDEEVKIGQAFELTKGHSTSLTIGIFLSYLIPILVLAIVMAIGGAVSVLLPGIGPVFLEVVSALGTFMMIGIAAGYMALVHRAFAPGDTGNRIAQQFD